MQIIPLNLDSVLLFLHNSKLAYWRIGIWEFIKTVFRFANKANIEVNLGIFWLGISQSEGNIVLFVCLFVCFFRENDFVISSSS